MTIDIDELKRCINKKVFKYLCDIYIEDQPSYDNVIETICDKLRNSSYCPSLADYIIDVDKGFGVSRQVKLFNIVDYCIYITCIYTLQDKLAINRIRNTYGGFRMGNDFRRLEAENSVWDIEPFSGSPYTISPGKFIKYWGDYNDKIYNLISKYGSRLRCIVQTDISNFYDSIRLDILENLVRGASDQSKETYINLLFYFLSTQNKYTNIYRPQAVGIPQDIQGDCSRILSNFYLQGYDATIDELCTKNNIIYLRYADDQTFFFSDGSLMSPRELINKCSIELQKLGLNLNCQKTTVYDDIDEYKHKKGIRIYQNLSQDTSPDKLLRSTANIFTSDFLQQYKHYSKVGVGISKTIAKIGIEKLTDNVKNDYLSRIYTDYLSYFNHVNINNLYKSMTSDEKSALINHIKTTTQNEVCSNFKYESFKFAQKAKVEDLYYLKGEIINDGRWKQ